MPDRALGATRRPKPRSSAKAESIVDQGQPLTAPYTLCLADGCVADYEASQELIGNMKKGPRDCGAGHQ